MLKLRGLGEPSVRHTFLPILLLLAAVVSAAYAQPAGRSHPAKAELLANTAAIAPGRSFTLGVRFELEPDWHIYWLNPGDSGMATSIKITAPPGFEVGPMQWPLPIDFSTPEVKGYGYAKSVMFTFPVKAPTTLADGPFAFTADARWLVCKEQCLPGKKALKLELSKTSSPGAPANEALFKEWAKQMPCLIPCPDLFNQVETAGGPPTSSAPAKMSIAVHWLRPPQKVEWFPGADSAIEIDAADIKTEGLVTRITFRVAALPGQQPAARELTSLVVATDAAGHRRGVYVPVEVK
jgi:DsbC/DsbD-like thiol-disulfide interchange protein